MEALLWPRAIAAAARGNPGNAPVIGTTTVAAMTSGVFWGYIGLIEGLVTRIRPSAKKP